MRFLPLLVLAIPAVAQADTIRVGRNSDPVVTPYLSAKVEDNQRIYDRGWKKCDPGGGAYTTKKPILEWDVTEVTELRIKLEEKSGDEMMGDGVIVVPDGTYVCADKHSTFWIKDWPKGHYQLYLGGQSIGVGAVVRIENPSRVGSSLKTTIDKLPVLDLDKQPTNPAFQNLPAQTVIGVADAGPTCAKGRDRIMPLAKIVATKPAPWFIGSGREHDMFVLTEDGHCINPHEAGQIPAGTHQLWTIVKDKAPTSYTLELDDRDAPLKLPDAHKQAATTLDDPLVVDGKVRPAEAWGSRGHQCHGAARAPDFYLTSDKPLQKVELSLLWGRAPQKLHVFGPIEKIKVNSVPQCADRGNEHTFDVFEGTYAVWVGGDDGAAGTDYHVLVTRAGTKLDPMATLVAVPEQLAMPERALKNHYPYFKGGKLDEWTTMFTKAPDQLFVYTRVDVDKIPAGEPLLVNWSSEQQTNAYRDDGTSVSIDTRLLTTDKPDKVVLPTTPRVPAADGVSQAIDKAGPEDDKNIAAYNKVSERYSACYEKYAESHNIVFQVDGNGNVRDVRDEVARAGDRACGGDAVDAAAKKLEKQLLTTRTARYKAHLTAVRKRFGL